MNVRVTVSIFAFALTAACREGPADAPTAAACGLPAHRIGAFVEIPAGSFVKGAEAVYPEESPEIRLHVDAFRMQIHEVTNDQFAEFVAATGYLTDAERSADGDERGAGSAVFVGTERPVEWSRLWRLTPGATWQTLGGRGSNIDGLGAHPVVHVSLRDARAYAAWAGGRLPDEVEWEYAAAPGLPAQKPFDDRGRPLANVWQGFFPLENTRADGFAGTAPAGCFPATAQLYDMAGNVWEWTDTPSERDPERHVIKGGSFLCSDNYCRRYRPAARQFQEIDFSTNHIGFRIVRDAPGDRMSGATGAAVKK